MNSPLVLIDILTEEGITGRGYAFTYLPVTLHSIAAFAKDISSEIHGKTIAPRSQMQYFESRLKLAGRQGFAGMAVGALDMALWDALARAADMPLVVMLGGEIRPLPAYDSYGILNAKTDLPWLEASLANGFKAIKIKLGAGTADQDVDLVAAVRQTIGDETTLMLDFNQSQTTASAVERIRRFAEYNLTWVEEPVAADDFIGHHAVRERVSLSPFKLAKTGGSRPTWRMRSLQKRPTSRWWMS